MASCRIWNKIYTIYNQNGEKKREKEKEKNRKKVRKIER